MEIKYHELLRKNAELGSSATPPYRIAALSNVTISQVKEIVEYTLRLDGVNALVEVGEYDNIAQDCERFQYHDCIAIFWEVANLIEDLPFRIHEFDRGGLKAIVEHATKQIDYVFEKLNSAKLVLVNSFSATPFTLTARKETELDVLCEEINDYIERNAPACVRLIDLQQIYCARSVAASTDLRYFLSSKALYSIDFYRAYADYIKPYVMVAAGKIKKALIFDCDNTLWRGILAEDGVTGIRIYKEIQNLAVALAKKGVIIGLCSKNNEEDVEEVLASHPDTVLTDEFIVIKAVNWEDKISNLKGMASSLNIGLDSFVFVDDSDFEVNLVREQLPEIAVIQVPKDYARYVSMLRTETDRYFFGAGETSEDRNRTVQYKTELQRTNARNSFGNIDDYLKALQLEMRIHVNPQDAIDRLSQLTLKTNQFNLTTRRYTANELVNLMTSSSNLVMAMEVSDKFGSYGMTGLAICRIQAHEARIDTLLLSCRILGRNLEFRLIEQLVRTMQARGITRITGEYLKSQKNSQVLDFYGKAAFTLVSADDSRRVYERNIADVLERDLGYIKVSYA
jgi:FkbH-like protein